MVQTVSVDPKILEELVSELRKVKREVAQLRDVVKEALPVYGSKKWWKIEVLKGEEDIAAGKFKTYKNARDMISSFHKSN